MLVEAMYRKCASTGKPSKSGADRSQLVENGWNSRRIWPSVKGCCCTDCFRLHPCLVSRSISPIHQRASRSAQFPCRKYQMIRKRETGCGKWVRRLTYNDANTNCTDSQDWWIWVSIDWRPLAWRLLLPCFPRVVGDVGTGGPRRQLELPRLG